jgi:hypothetical protein
LANGFLTFWIAFGRHLPHKPHEDGSVTAQFHPCTWTHLHAARLQVHRHRSTQRATEQGEHAYA